MMRRSSAIRTFAGSIVGNLQGAVVEKAHWYGGVAPAQPFRQQAGGGHVDLQGGEVEVFDAELGGQRFGEVELGSALVV